MAPQLDGSFATLRNSAASLLGFAGVFRRSEMVTLNVEDIEGVAEGSRLPSVAAKPIRKRAALSSRFSAARSHASLAARGVAGGVVPPAVCDWLGDEALVDKVMVRNPATLYGFA